MTDGPTRISPSRPKVFLHIGAPKTGTSFLQGVLVANRTMLADQGILVPPGSWGEGQLLPVLDVLARNPESERVARAKGAWKRFVDQVQTSAEQAVVLSMEFLAKALPDEVARIVGDLSDTDLHVVITARDLARQLPASWQESVQNGRTWTWRRYLSACSSDESSNPARHFRRGQDLAQIARVWREHVPAERIHVVTVPRVGPPDALWTRFSSVLAIDPSGFDLSRAPANPSLGAASAEVMRLVNKRQGRQDRDAYLVLKHLLAKRTLAGRAGDTKVVVPPRFRPWVVETSHAMVAELRELGLHVVGDLEDLVAEFTDVTMPERPDERAVLDAAIDGLVGLAWQVVDERRAHSASAHATDTGNPR